MAAPVLIAISAWSYSSSGTVWRFGVHLAPASDMVVTSPFFTLGSRKTQGQAVQGFLSAVNGNSWAYPKS